MQENKVLGDYGLSKLVRYVLDYMKINKKNIHILIYWLKLWYVK